MQKVLEKILWIDLSLVKENMEINGDLDLQVEIPKTL